MNTATKLGVFITVVAAIFGGAMAVGAAVGPIDVGGSSAGHNTMTSTSAPSSPASSSPASSSPSSSDRPRGLAIAEAGYRLEVETDSVKADAPSTFAFRIVDDNGTSVIGYQQVHDRPLHLIVVSRNLVDYLHLHPVIDNSGRWTVALPALTPGSYRVFADFQPINADNITLGADLSVPGTVVAVALPQPATITTVGAYTISLTGVASVGAAELNFQVERGGHAVYTDPYLGAAGHLVAIRSGDLAYLHVHPHDSNDSPVVAFTGEFPSAGTYRLFLDFSHDGAVHTAAFTVVVPNGPQHSSTDATTMTMTVASEGH